MPLLHLPTVKVNDLEEVNHIEVTRLIQSEKMPGDATQYEICPECRRIYDWRWFKEKKYLRPDWDMRDRSCACGLTLCPPHLIPDRRARQAFQALEPDVLSRFHTDLGEEEFLERLYSPLCEDHLFFLCGHCSRVYSWIEVGEHLVFQCVSTNRPNYDLDPEREVWQE